jgi:hypothetical protein
MDRDRQARTESQRILDRTSAESEPTMFGRARNHMAGGDANENDRVEVWGTRIGRWLGVALLIYLIWWLFDYFMAIG